MPKLILWLSDIGKDDIDQVGSKSVNLSGLYQSQIPIPKSFVITTEFFLEFLASGNLTKKLDFLWKKIDQGDERLLAESSNLIKKAISQTEISSYLAEFLLKNFRILTSEGKNVLVRTAENKNDFHIFLKSPEKEDIFDSIKKAWGSFFDEEHISRAKREELSPISLVDPLIVQKTDEPVSSGTLFSRYPSSDKKNTAVVEAAWGIRGEEQNGHSDQYEISKQNFEITNKFIATQTEQLVGIGNKKQISVAKNYQTSQKLSDGLIVQLAKIAKKMETLLGFPQKSDWFFDGQELFISDTEALSEDFMDKTPRNSFDLPLLLKGVSISPGVAINVPKIILSEKDTSKIKKGDIVVTRMTNQKFIPALKKASAIITDTGDQMSHAAIFSRKLGIPCIVGTQKATKLLGKGRLVITVDGSTGNIYQGSLKSRGIEFVSVPQDSPEKNSPRSATKIFVNSAEADMAREIAELQVDGLMIRTESFFNQIGVHPAKFIKDKKQDQFIDKLSKKIQELAEIFAPRPVILRAIDFTTKEFTNLKFGEKFEGEESNYEIGFRGATRFVAEPEVFELQLSAIKQARNKFGFKNIWFSVPFVRTTNELEQVKKMVSVSGLTNSSNFKLLMDVEVPSNIVSIEKFLDTGIDGILIDLNNMIEMLFAVDSSNPKTSLLTNEADEILFDALEKVIKEARKRKLFIGIYGQILKNPSLLEKLVSWGITSICVSPDNFYEFSQKLYSAENNSLKKYN